MGNDQTELLITDIRDWYYLLLVNQKLCHDV